MSFVSRNVRNVTELFRRTSKASLLHVNFCRNMVLLRSRDLKLYVKVLRRTVSSAATNSFELRKNECELTNEKSSLVSSKTGKSLHNPVMVDSVVDVIDPKSGQVIVDMTFGAGGHTQALLKRCSDITIYALDRDPIAHQLAVQLSQECSQIKPLLGRFTDLRGLLRQHGVTQIDAAFIDAGASSMQYDSGQRGFSISKTGPLDMRMEGNRLSEQVTAEDVVNNLDADQLFKIIKLYGEEKHARSIAHAIVDSRHALGRIITTTQLASIIASACQGQQIRIDKLGRSSHVATKTFQALRIFVNNELNELHNGIEAVHSLLKSGGVCAVISFHSLEDRIVKRLFHGIDVDAKANMSVTDRFRNPSTTYGDDEIKRHNDEPNKWVPLFDRKVVAASETEIQTNPRARSAKLRAAQKV